MAYNKKFIVLKELFKGYSVNGKPLSGIVRAESQDGVTAVNLSLIGFTTLTEGKYFAVISFGNGKNFTFDLGTNPVTFFTQLSIDFTDFACLIVHIADEVTPVAFGSIENSGITATSLTESLNFEIKNKKTTQTEITPKTDIQVQTPTYDDETVATENYYLYDDKEEQNEQSLFTKNVRPDAQSKNQRGGEKEEIEMFEDAQSVAFNEENYYLKVKDDLDKLFATMPPDTALNKSLPSSKWVKINYGEENHYVVGIIFKDSEPEYICYGVPAKYNEKPPKELDGICSFIPLSVFDMQGDGYWVIFQSAITGKCEVIKSDRT